MNELLYDQLRVDLVVYNLSQCTALEIQLLCVLPHKSSHCCDKIFVLLCLIFGLEHTVGHGVSKLLQQLHDLIAVDVFASIDTSGLISHPKKGMLEKSDQIVRQFSRLQIILLYFLLLTELFECFVD